MTDDWLCRLPFQPRRARRSQPLSMAGAYVERGVMILAAAERKLDIAPVIRDPRDPSQVIHQLPDILRARMFAIDCGYETATISIGCGTIRRSSRLRPTARERTRSVLAADGISCRQRSSRSAATAIVTSGSHGFLRQNPL